MRRRWSVGVVVAIAVAIAVALSSQPAATPALRAEAPATHITLALQSDGVALHIAHGAFVVTLHI